MGTNQLFDYIEKNPKEWKEFIEIPDNPDEMDGIRGKTRTGRPLGPDDFIEKLEGKLKRIFKLMPKGRPKKKVDKYVSVPNIIREARRKSKSKIKEEYKGSHQKKYL